MKKLVGPFAKTLGGVFAVGVFVIIISLSYGALGRIFPESLFDQAAGLLLFDAAAVIWFLQFVGNSRSVSQYVSSGLGFLLGLLGSIGLVGIEVGISSGMLIAEEMTKPLSYIFIGAAIGHLIVLYAFHGSEPEISAQISLGVEKAKVHAEGMRQAEQRMIENMVGMGNVISSRLVNEVLHDMNMRPDVIDARFLPMDNDLHADSNGYPLKEQAVSFFDKPADWLKQRFGKKQAQGPQVNETMAWTVDSRGNRHRVICMTCKREGKAWATPEPCDHILNATGEPGSLEQVTTILKQGFQEDAVG
jgi:hypothetical protein